MAADETITDAITDLVGAPRVFETDGQKVQERSLSELIEADKYLEQKRVVKAGGSGIRVQRVHKPLW
jgi:hypothetical protein